MLHFKEPKDTTKEGKNKYIFIFCNKSIKWSGVFSLGTQVKRMKAKKVRAEEILGR